ncbi:protein DJ-1 homolog D [Eucalyptus grandis]|uniref:protein DJ-1 homolog D n=1 Tax=Eucalyptus grandis TaxID=71139 RepID=UPI00192E883E|nr:protein DJ-1 homolog D [Eucalyptus grandis]
MYLFLCGSLGIQRDVTYSESRGHNFTLNATFAEIKFSDYDGLVMPGGRAPEYLAMDQSVVDFVSKFSHAGKPITTICHSQLILAAANIVKGCKCTAYPTVGPVLIAAGAHWVEPESLSHCITDGNLVTGVAYPGHPEFIQSFVKALGSSITGSEKRILFLCGDYMEDYEVYVPFQSLQALGCHVDAVCPKKKSGDTCPTAIHDFEGDQTYNEKPGHDFTLTADFEGLDASSYDALVIPGGRAPEYLALDGKVIALVKDFMEAKKPVASVCHGQQILAAAGVLKNAHNDLEELLVVATTLTATLGIGVVLKCDEMKLEPVEYEALLRKKCTAYPAVKLDMVLAGATWLEPDPIDRYFTDGNLVTGAAWPGHPEFIFQLMALLGIKSEERMRKEMERFDHERRKEEERLMREQQREEERLLREQRRESERQE